MGFSQTIFVDIPKDFEDLVFCSICFNVFDNPINSDCRDSFCRDCIENWINTPNNNRVNNNEKRCPLCRTEFRRKRDEDCADALIIISDKVFTRDRTINSMVNKIPIKCKYQFNGCQQIIEFGLLSAHIKNCEHRICANCDFTVGKDSNTHNCFQLLKNDRNEWKQKSNETNEEIKKLKTRLEEREKLMLSFNNHFNYIRFKTNFVVFGTYSVEPQSIRLYSSELNFHLNDTSFPIDYNNINKIMYCNHPSLPVLIIEVDFKSCRDIRRKIVIINRWNGWFNTNSKNSSEKYIITELSSAEKIDVFIELLSHRLSECKLQNICESIDEKRAKQMVSSARGLQESDSGRSLKKMRTV